MVNSGNDNLQNQECQRQCKFPPAGTLILAATHSLSALAYYNRSIGRASVRCEKSEPGWRRTELAKFSAFSPPPFPTGEHPVRSPEM